MAPLFLNKIIELQEEEVVSLKRQGPKDEVIRARTAAVGLADELAGGAAEVGHHDRGRDKLMFIVKLRPRSPLANLTYMSLNCF